MKTLKLQIFLLAFIPVLSFISCIEDDEAPTPTPPEPLECNFEFEPNAAGDACVCPPDKIQQDTILCYTLPENYWYANMAGCEWPIGMSFGPDPGINLTYDLSDSTTAWTYYEATDRYEYASELIRPINTIPSSSNPQIVKVPLNVYLTTNDGVNYDQVRLSTTDEASWVMPGLDYQRDLVRISFEGTVISRDSVVGTFFFGYDRFEPPFDFISLYECEGTFVLND